MTAQPPPVAVVGLGADGWEGLGPAPRAAVAAARVLLGAPRQLDLVPAGSTRAQRRPWPSPMAALLDDPAALHALADAGGLCVLASGDPLLHGVGASLASRLDPARLRIHPHVSAVQLACARLGWPLADVELVSAVARPTDVVAAALQPGRRLVVYLSGTDGAARLAATLRDRGAGASRLVVLEDLGAPSERRTDTTAAAHGGRPASTLHLVAVEVRADAGATLHPRTPGLPDDAYAHDGQLTKRDLRALAVCALRPGPGAVLWDVGAGSASVAIEFLRAEATARAVAVERRRDRAVRARENARTLGVPHRLEVVETDAPAGLADLPAPDAVFVGGGVSAPGVLDSAWTALRPGGRLVAHAVTLEAERAVHAARAARGGELTRIALAHADPVGRFEAWRPQMPVTRWSVTREARP